MPSDTRFGTFGELMDQSAESMRPIAEKLRDVVLDVDPETVEVVRLGDRAATYGVGPKKMSEGYAYILPHTEWVNFGFYRGTELPDPAGKLEGTGARMRHVKVRSVAEADDPQLRELLEAAIAERKQALA